MKLGIVGAGASAAAAAYRLRDHEVTVFEKSRGVCGRAATRRRNDCTYDYGANYVKSDDARVNDLLTATLDTDGLVDIEEPVYTFDAEGTIREGRDDDSHKWTYRTGLTQIAKRLFTAASATVHRETHVGSLDRYDRGWRIRDDSGVDLGTFDAVLLTPPAPQTADIVRASDWSGSVRDAFLDAVDAVDYRTVYTCVLNYKFDLEYPWYGLVNTDREHDCGWLSREELKAGHVPDGQSLLIAQMSPEWSTERYDDEPEAVCSDAAVLVADLLDDDRLTTPAWADHQGWRYALPNEPVDAPPVQAGERVGLYCAGDWVAGEGRVHRALRSGLDVAERIQNT